MRLPELCIRRPVFATVINLVILLIGIIAYQRLAVREYPNIDEPVVSVSATFRGASAEIIEVRLSGFSGRPWPTRTCSQASGSLMTISARYGLAEKSLSRVSRAWGSR